MRIKITAQKKVGLTAIDFDWWLKNYDETVASGSEINETSWSYIHTGVPDSDRWHGTYYWKVTNGNFGFASIQLQTDAGVPITTFDKKSTTEDKILHVYNWNIQPDTPTYLETLDKIDQWSKAQYFPNTLRDLKY